MVLAFNPGYLGGKGRQTSVFETSLVYRDSQGGHTEKPCLEKTTTTTKTKTFLKTINLEKEIK